MPLRCLTLVTICVVFITTEAVSGEDLKKAVGETVSFHPTNINPPVISIIWKHKNSNGIVVKAAEWDDDGVFIPNQRFKNITALDNKTGQITITDLTVKHSGVYTIDINSEEQEQKFTLKVLERVPKPVIKTEKSKNPDVVYLICEYNEAIIWKNSAGEVLKGLKHYPKGEFILVENKRHPDVFYTCTLDNGASTATSDPVYKRNLFKERVPKPVIKTEKSKNPDVVYLICEYNEAIIWKNSAGEVLKGLKHYPKGEFILVENKRHPDVFYTCTLDNGASTATSDPVYKRNLFKGEDLKNAALLHPGTFDSVPVFILSQIFLLITVCVF